MTRALTLTLRFLAVLAAIGVISVILAPSAPEHSPYASALTDLAGTSAMAAPPACKHTACNSTNTGCLTKQKGLTCKLTGNDCETIDCNP
jgi:hypothetical protein